MCSCSHTAKSGCWSRACASLKSHKVEAAYLNGAGDYAEQTCANRSDRACCLRVFTSQNEFPATTQPPLSRSGLLEAGKPFRPGKIAFVRVLDPRLHVLRWTVTGHVTQQTPVLKSPKCHTGPPEPRIRQVRARPHPGARNRPRHPVP